MHTQLIQQKMVLQSLKLEHMTYMFDSADRSKKRVYAYHIHNT